MRQILDIAAERTEISEESDTRRKKIELEEKKTYKRSCWISL